jgi:hypothetical protein
VVDKPNDISREFVNVIVINSTRFATQIITPLIGDDYAITRLRKRLYLAPPPIPEFRETMQQNDGLTIVWP